MQAKEEEEEGGKAKEERAVRCYNIISNYKNELESQNFKVQRVQTLEEVVKARSLEQGPQSK